MKNITSLFKYLLFISLAVFASCKDDDEDEEAVEVVDNLPKSGDEEGHAYVDLGLPSGTMWAQYCIDAYKVLINDRGFVDYEKVIDENGNEKDGAFRRTFGAEFHGRYFAWGETKGSKNSYVKNEKRDKEIGDLDLMDDYDESWKGGKNELYANLVKNKSEKTDYLWDYYKWGGTGDHINKYNTREMCGVVDSILQLESTDDAATVNWGGKWRMPTKEDLEELVNNCYWVYYNNYNGTKRVGMVAYRAKKDEDKGVVIGIGQYKSADYSLNDPHIFFRFSGFKRHINTGKGERGLGTECSVWSSTLNSVIPTAGYALTMDNHKVGVESCDRFEGRPIRPVFK